MAQSRLQIIIDVVVRGADQALSKLDQAIKGLAEGAIGATAALVAFGYAARKALDFAKQGADIDSLTTRFNNLAASIGTTGEALGQELGDAVGGVLSDAEMMAAALATLDSDVFKSLIDSGESLQDAFSQAFSETIVQQLEEIGVTAGTTAGQIAILDSAWKDFMGSAQTGFADLIGGIYETVKGTELLREAFELELINTKGYEQISEAVRSGAVEAEEAIRYLEELIAKYNELQDVTEDGLFPDDHELRIADEWAKSFDMAIAKADAFVQAVYRATREVAHMGDVLEMEFYDADEAAGQLDAYIADLQAVQQAYDDVASAAQGYFGIFDKEGQSYAKAIDMTAALVDALVDQAFAAFAAQEDTSLWVDAIAQIDPVAADAVTQALMLADSFSMIVDAITTTGDPDIAADWLDTVLTADFSEFNADAAQAAADAISGLADSLSQEQMTDALTELNKLMEGGEGGFDSLVKALEGVGAAPEDISAAVSAMADALPPLLDYTEQLEDGISFLQDMGAISLTVDSNAGDVVGQIDDVGSALETLDGSSATVTVYVEYPNGPLPDGGGSGGSGGSGSTNSGNQPDQGGGNVLAGSRYLVGEAGPELFIPYAHGEIIPNHELGGGKVINYNSMDTVIIKNPQTAAMHAAYKTSMIVNEFRGNL